MTKYFELKNQVSEDDLKNFICLNQSGHKPCHFFFLKNEALEQEIKKGEDNLINKIKNTD